MHRATALVPCMHNVCAGCASKHLARSSCCPSCRTPVTAIWGNLSMVAVVEGFLAARPGRKRAAEELSKLDEDEEHLDWEVARIVRQRRAVSILQCVQDGDVEAVLQELENGADVDELLEDGGSLLHIAVEAEDLDMVRPLLA